MESKAGDLKGQSFSGFGLNPVVLLSWGRFRACRDAADGMSAIVIRQMRSLHFCRLAQGELFHG